MLNTSNFTIRLDWKRIINLNCGVVITNATSQEKERSIRTKYIKLTILGILSKYANS